jgi:hypothetical protein
MTKADIANQSPRGRAGKADSASGHRPTRSDVAKQLGVSVFKVRCMEGKELHPEIVGGVRYFDPDEVASVALTLGPKRKKARDDRDEGEIAALAFHAFAEGRNLHDIVTQLRITPEHVRALYREWREPDLEQHEVARRKRERAQKEQRRDEEEQRRDEEEQRRHEKEMDRMERDIARLGRFPKP